tara:strand:- start:345 stop:509 length:165 start_codon:yes stop_codon:yes gene_type:complete
MTGAADASTSNIDIGREFSTSPISRQDLTAKIKEGLTDSSSKQFADLNANAFNE